MRVVKYDCYVILLDCQEKKCFNRFGWPTNRPHGVCGGSPGGRQKCNIAKFPPWRQDCVGFGDCCLFSKFWVDTFRFILGNLGCVFKSTRHSWRTIILSVVLCKGFSSSPQHPSWWIGWQSFSFDLLSFFWVIVNRSNELGNRSKQINVHLQLMVSTYSSPRRWPKHGVQLLKRWKLPEAPRSLALGCKIASLSPREIPFESFE